MDRLLTGGQTQDQESIWAAYTAKGGDDRKDGRTAGLRVDKGK